MHEYIEWMNFWNNIATRLSAQEAGTVRMKFWNLEFYYLEFVST
jgi:hypothetical protein